MMNSGGSNRVMKRCMKMTRKQASVMVEFMEAHPDFACGRYDSPQRKTMAVKTWNELKQLLDMHGGPKTVEQWRKAWKDLRAKTRAKKTRLLAEQSATEFDMEYTGKLTNLELRVLGITGVSEKEKGVSSNGNIVMVSSPSKAPALQQPPIPTTARSANNTQQAVIHQKQKGLGRSKVLLTDEKLDNILSKLDVFRAESLEVMKVVANGISSLAQGQRDILIIQKERLEFEREVLRLERQRVEKEAKLENLLADVVDCQRRMASALEQRAFFDINQHEEI